MSSNFNAGQSHGQAQAKTEQCLDSAKNAAHSATNKAEEMAQGAQAKAHRESEHDGAGLLQQGGEMVQGMVDGVKNTFGLGDSHPGSKK